MRRAAAAVDQALEAVLDPPTADVMVCVSHEGETELTMEAERAFGGDVWLVGPLWSNANAAILRLNL